MSLGQGWSFFSKGLEIQPHVQVALFFTEKKSIGCVKVEMLVPRDESRTAVEELVAEHLRLCPPSPFDGHELDSG